MGLNYTLERKYYPLGETERPDVWLKVITPTEEEILEAANMEKGFEKWRKFLNEKLIEVEGITFEGQPVTAERIKTDKKLPPDLLLNIFTWIMESGYQLNPELKKKYGRMYSQSKAE